MFGVHDDEVVSRLSARVCINNGVVRSTGSLNALGLTLLTRLMSGGAAASIVVARWQCRFERFISPPPETDAAFVTLPGAVGKR